MAGYETGGRSTVPASDRLNRFCASGLDAVNFAAAEIMSGQHDMAVGGGVESMSRIGIGASGGAWPADPSIALKSYYLPQGVSADLIATKDLRVGDRVLVKRAGEVIPQIIGPVPEKRAAGLTPWRAPSKCPACGTALERDEEEGEDGFRRYGHSRDRRPDLPQVVIGLALAVPIGPYPGVRQHLAYHGGVALDLPPRVEPVAADAVDVGGRAPAVWRGVRGQRVAGRTVAAVRGYVHVGAGRLA